MIVNDKTTQEGTPFFPSLAAGDVFKIKGCPDVFIKTYPDLNGKNAFNINRYQTTFFYSNVEVIPVKATLTIENK